MPAPALLNDFQGLARQAADRLRDLAVSVENLSPPSSETLTFALSDLASDSHLRELTRSVRAFAHKGDPTVYIFRLAEGSEHYTELKRAFARRPDPRQGKVGKCYSRPIDGESPKSIYVGSSWNLPSRISEHLGRTGGDGTYSMRLNLWALHVQASVDLTLCRFPPGINPIELEAIEQQIWDELSPILGKRSGK